MHPSAFELVHDHVRAIYRALTQSELPPAPAEAGAPPSADMVAQRFADLEALARSLPRVAERVPPFSFAPPLDAIDTERELVIEVAVSGVDKPDVQVEVADDLLVISGSRPGELGVEGRTYYHAEIPRGPFRRVVRLPVQVSGEPRVEVSHGLIRIRIPKAVRTPPARA